VGVVVVVVMLVEDHVVFGRCLSALEGMSWCCLEQEQKPPFERRGRKRRRAIKRITRAPLTDQTRKGRSVFWLLWMGYK
jgi:hypothetical protein